jgi:hypothetical protein
MSSSRIAAMLLIPAAGGVTVGVLAWYGETWVDQAVHKSKWIIPSLLGGTAAFIFFLLRLFSSR